MKSFCILILLTIHFVFCDLQNNELLRLFQEEISHLTQTPPSDSNYISQIQTTGDIAIKTFHVR